jgi:hypothetical protein
VLLTCAWHGRSAAGVRERRGSRVWLAEAAGQALDAVESGGGALARVLTEAEACRVRAAAEKAPRAA